MKLDVASGLTHEVQERGLPADTFLDRLGEQAAVGPHRGELIGVSQQPERQAGRGPRRGLCSCGQQIAHEAVDLLVRHPDTVDVRRGEDRHHVVLGLTPTVGKDADEVLLQLAGGLHRALHVGVKSQQVDREPVKLGNIGLG